MMLTQDTLELKTISKVSEQLGIERHTLRYWESKFPQLQPVIRNRRRYYRHQDIELIEVIRDLSQKFGYTLKRIERLLNEEGLEEAKRLLQNSSDTPTSPDDLISLIDSPKTITAESSPDLQSAVDQPSLYLNKERVSGLYNTINSTGFALNLDINRVNEIKLDPKLKGALASVLDRLKTLQNRIQT